MEMKLVSLLGTVTQKIYVQDLYMIRTRFDQMPNDARAVYINLVIQQYMVVL